MLNTPSLALIEAPNLGDYVSGSCDRPKKTRSVQNGGAVRQSSSLSCN